jgi:hypothetical protein
VSRVREVCCWLCVERLERFKVCRVLHGKEDDESVFGLE